VTSPEPIVAAAVEPLRERVRARFRRSTDAPTAFFDANAAAMARACRDLARSFAGGGRLFALGSGAGWSDALHVAVEFVHPVIVGKRALPAIALPADGGGQLLTLAAPGDAVIGLAATEAVAVRDTLGAARAAGLLTIALTGPADGAWPAAYHFAVADSDPFVVQEVHETCYHVFWELVHVFLDHPGALASDD
jgi:D-sedoheptulose 7-phosphate isomerase